MARQSNRAGKSVQYTRHSRVLARLYGGVESGQVGHARLEHVLGA